MSDDERTIDYRSAPSWTATLSITGRADVEIVGLTTVGREPTASTGQVIAIAGDPLVSKLHLALDRNADGVIITDLGSANGTFLIHDGAETVVPSSRWISVPAGATVEFGDQVSTIHITNGPFSARAVSPVAGDPGAGIGASAACPRCGRPLQPGANFCDGCGTSVATAVGVPLPAQPVESTAASSPIVWDQPAPAAPGPSWQTGAQSPNAATPRKASSRVPKVAAGIAVLAVVAGGATVLFLGDDTSSKTGTDLPEIPTTIEEQWSESVRGDIAEVFVGDTAVYVLTSSDDEYTVTSLAAEDGAEQWDVSVDNPSSDFAILVGEFDDVVVLSLWGSESVTVGIDRTTGDVTWERDDDEYASVFGIGTQLFSFEDSSVELVDPRDGSRIERLRVDDGDVTSAGQFVVRDGDEVEVFDVNLESVFGPVDVDEEASALSYTGSQIIAVVDDEMQLIDESGEVVTEAQLDDFDAPISAITVVDETNFLLETELFDEVVSVDVSGTDAEVRWSEEGFLWGAHVVNDDVFAFIESSSTVRVVDAVTGDRLFRVEEPDFGSPEILPGSNGVVASSFTDDGVDATARRWEDGEEIWSESFDGRIVLGPNAIVEIAPDGDVTLYR